MEALERDRKHCCAIADMAPTLQMTREEGFAAIYRAIKESAAPLTLPEWNDDSLIASTQQFGDLLSDYLQAYNDASLIVFLKGFDGPRAYWWDDLLYKTQYLRQDRSEDRHKQRLTFCLVGNTTLPELLENKLHSSFSPGEVIDLID
jgi:hypothetical protein